MLFQHALRWRCLPAVISSSKGWCIVVGVVVAAAIAVTLRSSSATTTAGTCPLRLVFFFFFSSSIPLDVVLFLSFDFEKLHPHHRVFTIVFCIPCKLHHVFFPRLCVSLSPPSPFSSSSSSCLFAVIVVVVVSSSSSLSFFFSRTSCVVRCVSCNFALCAPFLAHYFISRPITALVFVF